jgi:DNA-binding MurR/RpiR family transcriptional regulator
LGGFPTSPNASFEERVSAQLGQLSTAEREVTRFFQQNREEVLLASASSLASKIGTSNATVVRTALALGYASLADLRRQLADEIRADLSPASRLQRTLGSVGDVLESAFQSTLVIHLDAIENLRRNVSPALFASAVTEIRTARRVVVFGIGPSAAIASYFSMQLGRFGIEAETISHTGLSIADDLNRLHGGDLVIILAYGRVYLELEALLIRIGDVRAKTILLTDTLAAALRHRIDLILPVERGRVDAFSMHTATLAIIEALLVGIAAARPRDVLTSLRRLNRLRAMVAGKDTELGNDLKRKALGTKRRRKSADRVADPVAGDDNAQS